MANLTLTFTTRKRWFFWPAFYAVGVLAKAGVVTVSRGARWITDHAMRLDVE